MTATQTTNGRPRKQLSDQIDRMEEQLARQDGILDALADGLNQAVADAARAGVKEAVQAAVVEMLTNTDLRTALHKATTPPAGSQPSAWDRLKARFRQVAEKGKAAVAVVRRVVTAKVAAVKVAASGAAAPAWMAWRLRKIALVGLGVGLVVAALSYAASHGVAAALSGAGAAATAAAVQVGLWVRKNVRRLVTV